MITQAVAGFGYILFYFQGGTLDHSATAPPP